MPEEEDEFYRALLSADAGTAGARKGEGARKRETSVRIHMSGRDSGLSVERNQRKKEREEKL